jgi:methylated-DNA-[protein]-cysteine S-methyltransferase
VKLEPLYYDLIPDTMIGTVGLAATNRGLCRVSMALVNEDAFAAKLQSLYPKALVRKDTDYLCAMRRQIEEYLAGHRRTFDIRLDLNTSSPFQIQVLNAVTQIPYGCTMSYGEVAFMAGRPNAARAVGGVMAGSPMSLVVPCHRVLAARGLLGGFNIGLQHKRLLLRLEGATWKEAKKPIPSRHRRTLKSLGNE